MDDNEAYICHNFKRSCSHPVIETRYWSNNSKKQKKIVCVEGHSFTGKMDFMHCETSLFKRYFKSYKENKKRE